MDEPRDNGVRIAVAGVVVVVALLVAIGLGFGALMSGPAPASPVVSPTPSASPTTSPTPSPIATPSPSPEPSESAVPVATPRPSPTPTVSATPEPVVTPTPRVTARPTPRPTERPTPTPQPTGARGDPDDLPRFPGSRLVERKTGRDGDLATLELGYTTQARLDRVRRHYRAMLRRHGWFVGDVQFEGDGWDFEANQGAREASIELKRDGDGTEVEIEISWPAGDPDGGSRRSDDSSGPGG